MGIHGQLAEEEAISAHFHTPLSCLARIWQITRSGSDWLKLDNKRSNCMGTVAMALTRLRHPGGKTARCQFPMHAGHAPVGQERANTDGGEGAREGMMSSCVGEGLGGSRGCGGMGMGVWEGVGRQCTGK